MNFTQYEIFQTVRQLKMTVTCKLNFARFEFKVRFGRLSYSETTLMDGNKPQPDTNHSDRTSWPEWTHKADRMVLLYAHGLICHNALLKLNSSGSDVMIRKVMRS